MGHTMSFFKKPPQTKPFSDKIAKRVSKIPTDELEMWTDQALTEISRCMSLYSKARENVFLDEALTGAEALHAVINELHKRRNTTL